MTTDNKLVKYNLIDANGVTNLGFVDLTNFRLSFPRALIPQDKWFLGRSELTLQAFQHWQHYSCPRHLQGIGLRHYGRCAGISGLGTLISRRASCLA